MPADRALEAELEQLLGDYRAAKRRGLARIARFGRVALALLASAAFFHMVTKIGEGFQLWG